uniref:Uncharacterized protein n=1 Tax=Oryza barthii TaxID=65489 RepID=A0A0D3FNA4_9ORYZ
MDKIYLLKITDIYITSTPLSSPSLLAPPLSLSSSPFPAPPLSPALGGSGCDRSSSCSSGSRRGGGASRRYDGGSSCCGGRSSSDGGGSSSGGSGSRLHLPNAAPRPCLALKLPKLRGPLLGVAALCRGAVPAELAGIFPSGALPGCSYDRAGGNIPLGCGETTLHAGALNMALG